MLKLFEKTTTMLVLVVAGAMLFVSAGAAHAASKVLTGSGWRVHFGNGLNVTLDGVTSDRAEVKIEKIAQFTEPFDRGVGPTLELTFEQVDFDAVPYIVVDAESVFNQTGTPWAAFRFNLTEATNGSDEHVQFDAEKTFEDDDPFDIDPFTTWEFNSDFTELVVAGGTVPNDSVWTPGSGNDAGELVIYGAPVSSGTKRAFFFKEQPIIPLPAAAWTGLIGLAGIGLFAKKLRRSVT
jgi:hypothetical protein